VAGHVVSAGERLRSQGLAGEKAITVRFMHGEYFEMDIDFKLFFSTNHRPLISDLGHGMWRRIDMIPFNVTIPEAEIDYRLGNKLALEAPGILAWLVEGCMRWQARIERNSQGGGKPSSVKKAVDDYKNEIDGIGSFIADRCEDVTDARSLFSATYEAYRSWCGSERIPVSKGAFSSRLKERGYTIKAAGDNGSMTIFNLKFKDTLASSL
jgi:putative DNA primase/helicase